MDFRDAIEIARRNPGASVTRGEGGGFIVRKPDGTLLEASEPASDEVEQLKRENERLQQRYDDAFALLDETERSHRADIASLDAKIHQLQMSLLAAREESKAAAERIKELDAKIAKVSASEWERIKSADEEDRRAYAEAMRKERNLQKCSCMGEVENCVRCDGKGSYTTDGYGNIVYM